MAINQADVRSMDLSLGDLSNTLLQNRVLKQRAGELAADRAVRGNEFSQDMDMRRAMMDKQLQAQSYQQDPNNPLNLERTAQAGAADAKATKLQGGDRIISAYLADPDDPENGMEIKNATPTEYQTAIDNYSQQTGKTPIIKGKAPRPVTDDYGTFHILNGPTFTFHNKAAIDKFQAKVDAGQIQLAPTSGAMDTVKTETDATVGTPAIPGYTGLLGGVHPEIPAVPGTPKTTTIRHIPVRGNIGDSGLPNLVPPPAASTNAPITPTNAPQAAIPALQMSEAALNAKLLRRYGNRHNVQAAMQGQSVTNMPSDSTNAPAATPKAATPKDKAALANQLAQQHPDWTRQQIIQAVNGQ